MLKLKEITQNDKKLLEKFEQIYVEAFPESERIPIGTYFEMQQTMNIHLFAIADDENIIGLLIYVIRNEYMYVADLAINSNFRSMGYGSKVLKYLNEKFDEITITLATEIADKNAENYQQRLKRKNFYLSNGYYPTGYTGNIPKIEGEFELLANTKNFSIDKFLANFKPLMK